MPTTGVRLNRFLAQAGISSRRTADRLIAEGRVTVNGAPVSELGTRVDPGSDRVTVDGEIVRADRSLLWCAFHKPPGVHTTLRDTHGRPDLRPFLRGLSERVFPVGRLDADSEGLLLLTNDGDLAHRLMHPRYGVEKEYRAEVLGVLEPAVARRFVEGVPLEDGLARALRARVVRRNSRGGVLALVLGEGRKRVVRRMAETLGLRVTRLVRVRVGSVRLGDLAPGAIRPLEPRECEGLRALVEREPAGRASRKAP